MRSDRRARLCLVVAAPLTAKAFLLGHIRALLEFAEVTLVANFARADDAFPWPARLQRIALPIARSIAPWSDLRALAALYALFRARRFELVHSITPKAGLLAMLAAQAAGVPVRVHTFTGQVWATRSGWTRALLKQADRFIARRANQVLTDSGSQRDFLVAEGVLAKGRAQVLLHGSLCGVDAVRFRPDAEARAHVRRELGMDSADLVFLYLGRLNREKGLLELVHAFRDLALERSQLLIVGPDEAQMQAALVAAAGACKRKIRFVAATDRPEAYYAAADVFCLASQREGFPTTLLEAAATGLPAIATRIYGVSDAVVDGETGWLFAPGDAVELAAGMRALATDPGLRLRLGSAARARALSDYSAAAVTAALVDYYRARLRAG